MRIKISSEVQKNLNILIALLFVAIIGIAVYSVFYHFDKVAKERSVRLYVKIQFACNQEEHLGQAKVINDDYFCEEEGGALYPVRIDCSDDDPICAKDIETCRRMGYLGVKSTGHGTIVCRDTGDTLIFLKSAD